MRLTPYLCLAALALATAATCALPGFDRGDGLGGAGGAGAVGGNVGAAGGGGGGGGSAPCEPAHPPLPPTDAPPDGAEVAVAAIRRIRLLGRFDGGSLGYDLDDACTCDGDDFTCTPSAESLAGELYCDQPGGRDSALAEVLNGLMVVLLNEQDVAGFYSQAAEAGGWSVLFELRDYNGQADDAQVQLAVYPSPGMGAAPAPAWNGVDVWPIKDTAVAAGGEPLYVDAAAFVTGGTVVARLPTVELLIAGGGSRMLVRVTDAIVSARLDGGALLSGTIAGRLPTVDLFAMLSGLRNKSGTPLCTGEVVVYDPSKALICNRLDLLTAAGDASQRCDAISWALAFEAEPALLGSPTAESPLASFCDSGEDPATDSCPP